MDEPVDHGGGDVALRTYEYEATCHLDLVGAPVIEFVPRWGVIARVVPHSLAVQIHAWNQVGQIRESRRWAITVRPPGVAGADNNLVLREYDFQITPVPIWLLEIVDQVRVGVSSGT